MLAALKILKDVLGRFAGNFLKLSCSQFEDSIYSLFGVLRPVMSSRKGGIVMEAGSSSLFADPDTVPLGTNLLLRFAL